MVSEYFIGFMVLAVATGLSSANPDSCELDITVTYPTTDGNPEVACASQCVSGEQGFSIAGVAYQRFTELDGYGQMVRVNYVDGAFRSCELVSLQTDDELTATYQSCVQMLITPVSTTPVPTTEALTTPVPTPAPVQIRQSCPLGFTLLGDSCYLVTPDAKDDTAGWQYCNQFGAQGAVIESDAEQNALAAVLSTRVWIGINDKATPFSFVTSAGEAISYAKWNFGEPNNYNNQETCVMMIPEYMYSWNDDNCGVATRALCETTPIPVYKEPTCTPGQKRFLDSCYFFTDSGDYQSGVAQCKAEGGYPAVVNNQQEQNFLASILTENVYLGITDLRTVFVFASEFGVALYTNWSFGEPNNWQGGERCAMIISGYGSPWYDISCATKLRTLCEIPAA